MLPSLAELEKVSQKIKNIPNRQGEYKRKMHYCCFLLAYKSGLRIGEAIKFDLAKKDKNGLYRINKPKGKKERSVYVPKKVINELKQNNWKPNQTNRYNFYWFLQKIKRELNIDKKIELTPHTLRRSFTTYHAEKGVPLPILQKLLGHESIRTTILYWRNIYQKPWPGIIPANENDIKKWLEDKKEPPKLPITENFPQRLKKPESTIVKRPAIAELGRPDNHLIINPNEKHPTINYQPKSLTNEISPPKLGKFPLTNQQLPTTNDKEQILLNRIKQLEEQLKQFQAENANLKTENKHLKALVQQSTKTEAKVIQQLPFK